MFIRDKKQKHGNKHKEQNRSFIQPKLKMGKPGDKYEVEADKMADQVVNKSSSDSAIQTKENEEEVQQKPLGSEVTPLVQKKESSEEEPVQMMEEEEAVQSKEEEEVQMMEEEEAVQSKEEEEVQAKETKGKANKTPSIENRLRHGSGGQKLDQNTKQEMESGFGADFSNVNIHNDAEAQEMSNDIGAQAFTHGNDIYFNKGKYDPSSTDGKHLLAHELTHTIQQKGMVQKKIQRNPAALGLRGIWAALSSASVSEATSMAGLLLATGAAVTSVGSSIMPGQSGVQSVSLENGWMSNRNKQLLELIIQYRLINAYIDQYAQNNPSLFMTRREALHEFLENMHTDDSEGTSEEAESATPTTQNNENQSGESSSEPVVNTPVDTSIMEAVKIAVKLDIENELNANQRTIARQEFIWSDSGDHTADFWGTVGAIEFVDVRGTYLRETLSLGFFARQIPNIQMPMQGQTADIRMFRGGTMRKSTNMALGLNDTLGVNLSGSGPDIDQAGNDGHGVHVYRTDWNWDNNTTHGDFGIRISRFGRPSFDAPRWSGTPDD